MGISWHHVRALVSAYRSGICFDQTLTVGRLNLFISPHELRPLLAAGQGLLDRYDEYFKDYPKYAEPLFRLLGAREVSSIDASDYENATFVHDLNLPIPNDLKNRFDLVDDGGTLEHVFNFPTALRNVMEMVKVGGHLLLYLPCNNFAGHGFYQFSPELFFRALSSQNGFQVERLVMFETYDHSQWYEVTDPALARSRVEHVSDRHRVMLWVRAKRIAEVPIFQKTPQQSDYHDQWWQRPREGQSVVAAATNGPAQAAASKPSKFLVAPDPRRQAWKRVLEALSPSLLNHLRSRKRRQRNSKFTFKTQARLYKPVIE